MGLSMPGEVRIVAIEAESVFDFRSELSPPVAAAVEAAVLAVLAEVAGRPPEETP
jgi:Ni,Fe-hydrogenase maturation factor